MNLICNHWWERWTLTTELAQSPKTTRACDLIRPGYRCQSVERHMIYFRITAYGIAIIRILHDRMDAQRHL
jgi:toxin ParE1/3/4